MSRVILNEHHSILSLSTHSVPRRLSFLSQNCLSERTSLITNESENEKKTSRTTTRGPDTQHISASSWFEVYRTTRERPIPTDCLARWVDKIRLQMHLLRKDDKRHLHAMQHTQTVSA